MIWICFELVFLLGVGIIVFFEIWYGLRVVCVVDDEVLCLVVCDVLVVLFVLVG